MSAYRESRDFNGLYFDAPNENVRKAAIELTLKGFVQVVSEEDYPNPYIRPWPSKRTIEQQVASLKSIGDSFGVCLYPTPKALKEYPVRNKYSKQPYTYEMSMGRGTLELAYFRFDVLEGYRNDPKYDFDYDDFGASISISSDSYLDSNELEDDKILIQHIGFAYDFSKYNHKDKTTPLSRHVCMFYGYLAKLSPTHQQRWKTYEIRNPSSIKSHPVWWAQQMGQWPEGIGPFFRFFAELKAINELHNMAFSTQLFKTIERPQEFGWILRPSQKEWDTFIHQLDKLISENVRTEALAAMKAPIQDKQGNKLGTLKRLAEAISMRNVPMQVVMEIMKPLFEVRAARQKPAHTLRVNTKDNQLTRKQVQLMEDINYSLECLRRFWQKHPLTKSWEEPDYLAESARKYVM